MRVLSDRAPDLHEALEHAAHEKVPHLILDGTIITTDRLAETKISVKGKEIDSWYSGKARCFGGNIQVLTAPNGIPLWVSDVRPGSMHDLTVARELVPAILWPYARVVPVLADAGLGKAANSIGRREARYRGRKKIELEHYLGATAINITRLDAHFTHQPLDHTTPAD